MRSILLAAAAVILPVAAFAATTPSSSVAGDATAVVVSQGDAQVTLRDVDAYAQTIPRDKRRAVFSNPDSIETILRGILMTKQEAHEARTLGLDHDPLVAAQVRYAVDQTLAGVRADALRKEIAADLPNMAELARERYMADPAAFAVPEEVDVKHILISTKDRTDADAKALATKLYAQLKADPSKFDAYVTQYSDDQSKTRNHGLIQGATSNRLVTEFRVGAGKLTKIGEISPPVKSPYGYHLIKLIKLVPAKPRTFDQVRTSLVAKLRNEYITDKVQHHFNALRSRKLDANPALVKSLTTRYADESTDPATAASVAPEH